MAQILVVDGSRAMRRLVTYLLESEGHEVEEAATGLQALECVALQCFDMVLLDADAPHMNGWEVCRRLHQMSPMPILIMATDGHPSIREQALACGGDAVLVKPIALESLLDWVRFTSQHAKRPGPMALLAEALVGDPRQTIDS